MADMTATLKDKVLDLLEEKSGAANPFVIKTEEIATLVKADITEVRSALGKLSKEDKISTRRGGPRGTQIYVGSGDFFPATEPKTRATRAPQAADGERVVGTFYCVECGSRNLLTERVETRCPRCNEVLLHPGKYCIYCGFPLSEAR